MKTQATIQRAALAVLLLATFNLQPSTLLAQSTAFTYQGRLKDGGQPANGTYDFQFRLASDSQASNYVGSPVFTNGLPVAEGLFTVELDFGPSLFSGSNYWLEVNVRSNGLSGYSTLAPLQPLTPAPGALFAALAGNAGFATNAGTATTANTVAWSNITGIPAGFADGVDNDTQYSAGTGLVLNGTQFSVSFGGNGTAATVAHSDHQHDGVYAPLTHTHAATDIVSGTLADGRLSTNVALLNGNQSFSGTNTFTGTTTATNGSNQFAGKFTGDGGGLTNLSVPAAGLTGTLPVASGGTGGSTPAAARSGLGAAASGVNADITSLSGLSTPLSVAQGGTGASSTTAALSNLGAASLTVSNLFKGVNQLTNTANRFVGDGSGLTGLNASQLTAGTIGVGQLPAVVLTNGASGVNLAGSFSGNGAGVTNVQLVNINSSGAISFPGAFVLGSSPGVGNEPAWVTAADINKDGRVDLISANFGAKTLSVLTNNGSGGFILASSPNVGSGPYSVVAADVNGDGEVDLISANTGDNTLSVLINNGSGGFVLASSPAVGTDPLWVTASDINGDGKIDLITANFVANTLSVLTNNGSGGFVLASSPVVGNGPVAVVAADVNGDGKVDLISANANDNTLSVLTNNGSGGFTLASTPGTGSGLVWVVAADVNGDGRVDLISANTTDNDLSVLTNSGSGGFVLASSPAVGPLPYAVTAADVNGDGKVDLISANDGNNTLSVLTNNGSGSFVLASSPVVGSGPYSVVVADVNGDGSQDLITANFYANTLSVLLNRPTFHGDGSQLSNLNAADISAGTLADARLSANVALLDAIQTFTASQTIAPPASLSFGSTVRQMINLWGTNYGIGVQGSALYFRAGSVADGFNWFLGGSHSDVNGDPGSGGQRVLSLNSSGLGLGDLSATVPLEMIASQAVARFTSTNAANGAVLELKNSSSSPSLLGAINFNNAANSFPGQIAYTIGNTFTFRTAGGQHMTLDGLGNLSISGAYSSTSDRNAKENFKPIDPQVVLDKVAALPVSEWNYKADAATRHVGPMAQDFYAAFGVGPDDKHISTVDADGVALAAIQGLNQKFEERTRILETELKHRDAENAELKQKNESLEHRLDALEKMICNQPSN